MVKKAGSRSITRKVPSDSQDMLKGVSLPSSPTWIATIFSAVNWPDVRLTT